MKYLMGDSSPAIFIKRLLNYSMFAITNELFIQLIFINEMIHGELYWMISVQGIAIKADSNIQCSDKKSPYIIFLYSLPVLIKI
jgi:hypothetical protein